MKATTGRFVPGTEYMHEEVDDESMYLQQFTVGIYESSVNDLGALTNFLHFFCSHCHTKIRIIHD